MIYFNYILNIIYLFAYYFNRFYGRYSFFPLNIRAAGWSVFLFEKNIAEKNIDRFLKIAKKRLEKLNYQVYFTGANYSYNGEQKIVETNKYMVAIKNKEDIKN